MSAISTATTAAQYVVSRDGTSISYQTAGAGPAVIVIPGCMSTAASLAAFSAALAENFTVHTIERRGRGLSGPQGDSYSIAKECEDLAAVRAATGARFLVGHSYGGLISLEAARQDAALEKIAIYEPGVSVDGLISMSWIPVYRRKLAEQRLLDAFVEFSVAAGPEATRKTPKWLMKAVMLTFFSARWRRQMMALLPANLLEHEEVRRCDNTYENYREVSARTLLMYGGKGNLPWVAPSIEALSRVLPHLQKQLFPTLNHFGPDQKGPAEVARVVADFFRN